MTNTPEKCFACGGDDTDLRMGCCFDCATKGEERAANRTVLQHLIKGFRNLAACNGCARFDFAWAWERLTKTGDYAPDGEFEHQYGIKP